MKRNKIVLIFLILAIMLTLFVGCADDGFELTRPVSTPKNIKLKDGIFIWDNVKNADEYEIEINNEKFSSIASEYSGFAPLEQYTVRVRAKNLWSVSDWSPYISFKIVATPTNLIYVDDLFIWDEVEGAEYYVVQIDGVEFKLPKGNKSNFFFLEAGTQKVKIKAVGDNLNYFDSKYSEEITVRIEPIMWSKIKKAQPLGDGSVGLPFQIANIANLKWVVETNNYNALAFRNKKLVQTNDIDCRFIQGFEPIGTLEQQFIGEYDAKGFSIRYLNVEADNAAIFGYLGLNGKVINLVKAQGECLGVSRAGGIVANNYGTVMNCVNTGYVKASIAGGIVGENTDSRVILNSVNKGDIVGSDAGGIVGWNWSGLVNSCENSGSISAISRGGGLVAMNAGSIINSQNNGVVMGNTIGGLAGENNKSILSSKNSGEIITQRYGGGLVGVNVGNIAHSYSSGKISYAVDVQSVNVGGLVGRMNDGFVKSSFSTTEIAEDENYNVKVGSVVGYYRSGLLNLTITTAKMTKPLGNTDKYIGEILQITQKELSEKDMVNKLNKTVDYSEIYIYDQQMWIIDENNNIKLYWEK